MDKLIKHMMRDRMYSAEYTRDHIDRLHDIFACYPLTLKKDLDFHLINNGWIEFYDDNSVTLSAIAEIEILEHVKIKRLSK